MEIIQKHFLPNFILVTSLIYIWHKLLNRKINFKDYRLYISLIGIMAFSIGNYLITDKFFKITLITIAFMFFFKFLFNESIQKCIITPIYYQLIIMISESIFASVLIIVFKNDTTTIINSYFGEFISNVIISIISIIIINIKFVPKLYKKIITYTDRLSTNRLLVFSFIMIILGNMYAVFSYYKIKFQYIIIFNAIITIASYAVIMYSIKTQNRYNKVSDKYNIAINSLKDYEDMMSKYRISNHENKNLLLAVRAMIVNKDKDIPKYIDSIIHDKYNDSEKLLMKVNVIPSGGLRATIYSEILKIKGKKINYSLTIDKKLKTIDLIELDTNTVIDMCKIIGVLIDNAIEEVITLNKKNIDISIYIEDDRICIQISNNYKSKIEIDKIYEIGYSTKGKGHGYGLPLVNKIVEKNPIIKNNVNINKYIFTQIISIDYKKRNKKK